MAWQRGRAYAQDLRDRVLAAPGRLREVAERFGVSPSYVSRARTRRSRLGQVSPGSQCNHVPLRLAKLKDSLLAQVALAPEQTLLQLCQWVQSEHGLLVGPTTMAMAMGKTLTRLGLTRKKRPSLLEEQARSDVAQARADWLAERPQPVSGQGRLIFLDETWATTCMTPIWGRSPKGERCLGHAPFGHWHTTTFVCALEAPVDCWRRWCLTDRSMVLHL